MDTNPVLMNKLSLDSDIPLYSQLVSIIKRNISAGTLTPGALLPSEAELCRTFDVARSTVRQAIGALESEGLVVRKQGRGTFVEAEYRISHVDRMPLGDFGGVCLQLVTMNPAVDFRIRAEGDGKEGVLDTREVRAVLGEDISLSAPEVRAFLKDYIQENLVDIFGGRL